MEDDVANAAATPPVAEQLRRAREAQGLDLGAIAERTRIPLRHLEAIEASDYAALPSSTYALGFVRSYARAVGLDATAIAHDLRVELGREPAVIPDKTPYEPADPARLPSKLLAWTAALLAVLVIGGYGLWRHGSAPQLAIASDVAAPPPAARPAPRPVAASTDGEVVLTATAPVWVNIRDGAASLVNRELAAGERFVVPPTAADPRIVTGRPEALNVTVAGQAVAPLGQPAKTVRNVSLKGASLRARGTSPDSVARAE